ncbi:hypothetical protein N9X98_03900 [Candidatus Poseidoniales archaeon]|nr:hypothetical protein [Candidatus Poseidoniales archaeon]
MHEVPLFAHSLGDGSVGEVNVLKGDAAHLSRASIEGEAEVHGCSYHQHVVMSAGSSLAVVCSDFERRQVSAFNAPSVKGFADSNEVLRGEGWSLLVRNLQVLDDPFLGAGELLNQLCSRWEVGISTLSEGSLEDGLNGVCIFTNGLGCLTISSEGAEVLLEPCKSQGGAL